LHPRNGRSGRIGVPLALLLLAAAPLAAHADEPRYGDSTWVAPYPVADSTGDPTAPGPRVSEPKGEPVGETILRTPFRIIGLPFRALFAGFEWLAGVGAPHVFEPHVRVGVHLPYATISPTFDYTAQTGFEPGFSIHRAAYREDIPDITIHGSWSFKDQRRASFRLRVGSDSLHWNGGLFARYRYTPTTRFYGVGNFTHGDNRSYYLAEKGEINAFMAKHLTKHATVRLIGGINSYASRHSYNGTPPLEQNFAPSTIEGYGHDSRMVVFGANGEWAKLNRGPDPYAGIYVRGEIQRYRSLNGIDVQYVQWDGEVRGYIPVGAQRRVLALRAVYEAANPDAGSNPIPFDRLPAPVDDYRFLAYHGSQFRDQQVGVGQIEYRWLVFPPTVQMYALAQIGEVAPSQRLMRMDDIHESYGGGLRYFGPNGGWVRGQVVHGAEGFNIGVDIGTGF